MANKIPLYPPFWNEDERGIAPNNEICDRTSEAAG
jgi:hypothetical protein